MSAQTMTTDTNEEDQLNIAIKMIYSSFEKQNNSLSAEINRLNDALADLNIKRNELEMRCNNLIKESKENEDQIILLSNQNILLTQSIKELSLENSKLKIIKNDIIATIGKHDSIPKTTSHEGFSPNHQVKTNIKFNKPIMSCSRNKHMSIDNYSKEEIQGTGTGIGGIEVNQSYTQNKPTMRMTTTSRNSNGNKNYNRNTNGKLPMNLLSELGGCNNTYSSTNILKGTHFNKNLMINNSNNSNCNNNNFFKNCRKTMSQHDYDDLIEIVRGFNQKKISKQDTFLKIAQILEMRYSELFNDFKVFFYPNNDSENICFN